MITIHKINVINKNPKPQIIMLQISKQNKC